MGHHVWSPQLINNKRSLFSMGSVEMAHRIQTSGFNVCHFQTCPGPVLLARLGRTKLSERNWIEVKRAHFSIMQTIDSPRRTGMTFSQVSRGIPNRKFQIIGELGTAAPALPCSRAPGILYQKCYIFFSSVFSTPMLNSL